MVAKVATDGFTEAREPLLAAIKADGQVQAVDAFTFEPDKRTLTLDIATIYSVSTEAKTGVAYSLATQLAPLFWGPSIASKVRPSSLPSLVVIADDLTFRCPPESVVALAIKELSQVRFVEQCR